jgi:ATP synthase protein I
MEDNDPGQHERFAEKIRSKETRKKRARDERGRGILFGMGMFGLVGWSVAIPTLVFLALGIWIDARVDSPYSWTLMLLVLGIGLGCLNAWYWVREESQRGP